MGYICIKGHGECDGCLACKPEPHYYCPVCGKEVFETVYVSDSEVIGCENCTETREPYEVLEDEAD
jgi:hypothetical protein